MNPNPNKKLMPASRTTLIMEGIALGGFALALSSQYWIKDEPGISPPPSAVIAGLIFLPAMGVGIVAAIMLIINILRKKIDLGTIIAVVPFLGFAIWGIWYSYTDPTWERNISTYWILLGVILALWLYIITRYIKQRVDK